METEGVVKGLGKEGARERFVYRYQRSRGHAHICGECGSGQGRPDTRPSRLSEGLPIFP